eukprot:Pgem_evm1s13248
MDSLHESKTPACFIATSLDKNMKLETDNTCWLSLWTNDDPVPLAIFKKTVQLAKVSCVNLEIQITPLPALAMGINFQ